MKSLDEAIALSNRLAPEHLELLIDNPQESIKKIKNAGAIFMGRNTPEALGDYLAGPSHVLPTSRSAKFSSGLSVFDFLKKISLVEFSKEGIEQIGDSAIKIADNEGIKFINPEEDYSPHTYEDDTHENGNEKEKGSYSNGIKIGTWISYYKDGVISSKGDKPGRYTKSLIAIS